MLSHDAIWQAIDRLALQHNLSPSGLARMAGLDATIFNPSKRVKSDGRPRWPSTESIAKILQATRTSPWAFFIPPFEDLKVTPPSQVPPLETKASISTGEPKPPSPPPHNQLSSLHLVELTHDFLSPCYDCGDLLLVSMDWPVEARELIAVYSQTNDLMVYRFESESPSFLVVRDLLGEKRVHELPKEQVCWWARILWVAK